MKTMIIAAIIAATTILTGTPTAHADNNCVDRGIGATLCRNPDNTLTYCGFGPLSKCQTITQDQASMLPPGPQPGPFAAEH